MNGGVLALMHTPPYGRNEAGREGVQPPNPALDTRRCRGANAMPDNGSYRDSVPADNREHQDNWKPLGDLARRLVEKAKEARDGR